MKRIIPRLVSGLSLMGLAAAVAGCSRAPQPAEASAPSDPTPAASAPAGPEAAASSPGKPASILDGDAQPEVEDGVTRREAVGRDEGQEGHHDHFAAEGTLITNHGIPILMQTQTAGGFTPQRRAEAIAGRLNQMAGEEGFEASDIVARRVNGFYTVYCASPEGGRPGHVLATVDSTTAAQFGFGKDPAWLAFWWRDVLRDHALIISGAAPIYTTPYIQSLQRLYTLCQRERKGVPSPQSFEKALSALTPTERDALQSLYIRVPSLYRPLENAAP